MRMPLVLPQQFCVLAVGPPVPGGAGATRLCGSVHCLNMGGSEGGRRGGSLGLVLERSEARGSSGRYTVLHMELYISLVCGSCCTGGFYFFTTGSSSFERVLDTRMSQVEERHIAYL